MKRKHWSPDEIARLRDLYPILPTADVAMALGRNTRSVYNGATQYGVTKSAEYLKSDNAKRIQRGCTDPRMMRTRFPAGHTPWNAGQKGWRAGGRSKETRFAPGHRPHTWLPIGSERVTDDGTLQRKVSDTGDTRKDWRAVHALLWERAHGQIPPGHIAVLKNRDKRDIRIENVEVISRAENMRRNSYHRYPKEIALAIQLRGALNRQINKHTRAAK